MPYFAKPYVLPSPEEIMKSENEQRAAFKRAVIAAIGEEGYRKYSFEYRFRRHKRHSKGRETPETVDLAER